MGWVSGDRRFVQLEEGLKEGLNKLEVVGRAVWKVGRNDGTTWAGPVNGIIDQESYMKMGREWAGRVGLNGQESDWGYQAVQTGRRYSHLHGKLVFSPMDSTSLGPI